MQLHIAPHILIAGVQEEFNRTFPFLKLEFFRYKDDGRNGGEDLVFPPDKSMAECGAVIQEGVIEIEETMQVSTLEQLLKERFGLHVQVYRRSVNLWLQTTITDHWSLQKQNEHGMEISSNNIHQK
ncbi:MAG: hypothetical protein QM802_24665 [Agriterribacter sp.]